MLLKKGSLGLSALVFILSAVLPWSIWETGSARAQGGGGDWKPITLLYSSDTKGKIEPCG